MNKYIVTEEQLQRLERVHILLAREIRQNTFHQVVDDSMALIKHLANIAKQLIKDGIEEYKLPVEGGEFIWKSPAALKLEKQNVKQ